MATKRKKSSNPKRNAVLTILLTIIVAAVCLYTVLVGLGPKHLGSAKNIELGLDLAGGVSVTYEVNEENPSQTDMDDTRYKLQLRVQNYSTESEVYQEGSNRLTVEIPGATNANEILEELGKPGDLSFQTEDGTEVLTGANIKSAEAGTYDENGINNYVVSLTMDEAGKEAFADATAANIGKPIYIYYDGQVVSAPTVQSAITEGECVIENMESYEEAEELASTIRIGALPLTLTEVQSNVVGARLGQDAIDTSLFAGAIGIVVIFLFMTILYRIPGLLSGFALLGYVILNLLAINGFNATLTLPGIAGVILAIGMAVDANVIIFTRIKEEINAGKTVINAIETGYHKALSAILDGNITTLIAAAVLWIKGSGTVKGFAQTLAIGIILSMFTALFVTKKLMMSAYSLGLKDEKFYGRAKVFKVFNYIKFSKFCMIGSLIVIVLGFVFLPINQKSIGHILNYDLDFSGGTAVTLTLDDAITDELDQQICDTVRDVVGGGTVQSQKVQGANELVVKTGELSLNKREELETTLKDSYAISDYQVQQITGSISSEMRQDAVVAVAISAVCMLIYVAFRFRDVKFGVSAVLALLHDVLCVFTVYSVAKLSVGSTFIACMLTILGYSITATIVIFDRIRENLRDNTLRKQGIDVVVNTSISQTLTRSINTSLTTFITITILYIVGVAAIKEFSLTLMCGVVFGAYSSVCITGPLWYRMKMLSDKRKAKAKKAEEKAETPVKTSSKKKKRKK
ncbi:MAG TPA: protein translocase subunit SecD [Candidatus Anaerobutyricum stercoripullorum]|uniref:Multifunctional fusion protein n=1 Tax=Candidatus Anaerobutyricum stercoripullorum TaxID=2838456 RepID=A0A9D1X462_9FIRM|nr:protein translocase subunit SecD [Candidatus Anaerobutyricum stercoripullorum]